MLLLCVASVPALLQAEIRLTMLPERERTFVRFEDSGHVLVEEVRTLTLEQGHNVINFTWLGVSIDRGSIQLLPVSGAAFSVHSTRYPPNQGNSLVWNTWAEEAGSASVRISYLLRGLSRELDLRATINPNPTGNPANDTLSLRVFQQLMNSSGENFDQATLQASFGDVVDSPLASGEIRKQLAAKFTNVPYQRSYTFDPQLFQQQVAVHYLIPNTHNGNKSRGSSLGQGVLPGGKVRVFQQQDNGTTAFLGEDIVPPTPQNGDMRIRIGSAQDITVRRTLLGQKQDIIREYRRRATHFHHLHHVRFEVENFSGDDKTIDLIETIANGVDSWTVTKAEQWLERRTAPEVYEKVQEPVTAGSIERANATQVKTIVTVPPERRMVIELTLKLLDQRG